MKSVNFTARISNVKTGEGASKRGIFKFSSSLIYYFKNPLNVSNKINPKQSLTFISVINQLDAQNFCFTISLFHAPTCFEHMRSSSGGQNCITHFLVLSHL